MIVVQHDSKSGAGAGRMAGSQSQAAAITRTKVSNHMYTVYNFKTKKELKQAVDQRNLLCDLKLSTKAEEPGWTPCHQTELNSLTRRLEVFQFNGDLTGVDAPKQGRVALEGPHYPQPHRWYASGTVEDGILVEVS